MAGGEHDGVTFLVNLGRTGGDVVWHLRGGAVLVNDPQLAHDVLTDATGSFSAFEHPFPAFRDAYSASGCKLLGLPPHSNVSDTKWSIADGFAEVGRLLAGMIARAGATGLVIDPVVRASIHTLMVRALFGIDVEDESLASTQADAHVEECLANGRCELLAADPGRDGAHYRHAVRTKMVMLQRIAHEAGLVRPNASVPDSLSRSVEKVVLNGYVATAVTACWALDLLARHLDIQNRVLAELEGAGSLADRPAQCEPFRLLRGVVLETLRLYPPAWALRRRAERHARIGRTDVPMGTWVTVSPYLLHRDGRIWSEPTSFQPSRFVDPPARFRTGFLPFGIGPKRCPAAPVVVSNLPLLLAAVLKKGAIEAVGAPPRRRGLLALHPYPGVRLRRRTPSQ